MTTKKYRFLTENDKKNLFKLETSKRYITDNFTLEAYEIRYINKLKKDNLKFGYATQYLLLKNLGYKLQKNIPIEILNYIGEQLEIYNFNLENYIENNVTRKRHFAEITKFLGFSKFKIDNSIIKLAEKITFKISNHLDIAILFISKLKGVASGKCGFTTLRAFSPLIPRVYRLL